ncbi:MAG: flagellar hook-associated protein FlgK [Psychromonas sp.]|nr:flagellar hook-associated protein FlgK [Psychromonas sp.]
MADLFQIGLSGVYSAQASLTTTGHNVANVNTEGYSRQTAEIHAAQAGRTGNYFVGNGSLVHGISRAYNQFAFNENIMNTSLSSNTRVSFEQNNQIDQLLSNEYTSATKPVLTFFNSMNVVATNPNLIESRIGFLESAKNMASQYNRLYENLDIQYSAINHDISDSAQTMTVLANNLAEVNMQISAVYGGGGQSNSNDLLDTRDQLINSLSEYANVSVLPADKGMVNIYIGSGQALVMGGESLSVVSVPGVADPTRIELALSADGKLARINGAQLGGRISALFDARLNGVERSFNQLGQNVIGLTHAINEYQKSGQTLEGNIGEDIFNDINSVSAMKERVLIQNDGLSNAVNLSVRIDDISQLSADEFDLTVTNYDDISGSLELRITNVTTGKVQTVLHDTTQSLRVSLPNSGISLGLDNISNLETGKSFILRPTRMAAEQTKVVMIKPELIAAADAEVKLVLNTSNLGTTQVRVSKIVDRLDSSYVKKDQPITFEFNVDANGNTTYQIFDSNNINVLGSSALSVDMRTGKGFINYAGVEIELVSGAFSDGDKFTLNFNETGDGDNRNMVGMSDLQTKKIMGGNKLTFQDLYSSIVSKQGAKTANADIAMQSTQILKNQSFERLQNAVGVNLDEEAANLLKYQQHYGAAARIISVANEIFNTILQASR